MVAINTKINDRGYPIAKKNVLLFSIGKTISIFGTVIFNFAIGLYVLKLTGSALSFSMTLIIGIIPAIIINPFAGVIADKINKKLLVVSMDLLNGLLLVFVYVLCMNYTINLPIIYVTNFLLTVFSTFLGIGLEAAKPNIVSDNMLMNLNSISKIIDSVSSISGPMLGGVIFSIMDIRTFIIVNGVSFFLSGLSMLFMDFKLYHHPSNEGQLDGKIHFLKDIKDGIFYLCKKKGIKSLFTILISINFFLGFAVTVPLPYIVNTILKLSAKEFGMIEAAFPVGMILGALLVNKVMERISYSILLKYLCLSLSIFMIITGVPIMLGSLQVLPIFFTCFYSVVMFFFGVIIAFIDIPLSYIIQKEIPDEYRGRVLSIILSVGKMMLPAAMLSSGILLNHIPSYLMPVAGGIVFLLSNLRSSKKLDINFENGKMSA